MQNSIIEAIDNERRFQDSKWGRDKQQSLPGILAVMRGELEEADDAWLKNKVGTRQTPLEEILQIVAVGVACLERYGVSGSATATDDLPNSASD